MSLTCVYTVREGKIHAFEFFRDPAEALEAVGRKAPRRVRLAVPPDAS